MQPKDVEARLQAVLTALEARRQSAKQALDAAWNLDSGDCTVLLAALQETHAKAREFADVSRKALPLLQALGQIESLRHDAVTHLERLTKQADESRRLKAALAPTDLAAMTQIPDSVGEHFDLGLLGDDQLEQIRAAHAVLVQSGGVAVAAPCDLPEAVPTLAPPEPAASSPSTVDVTLEEWAETVQSLQVESTQEPEGDPVGLPGDEALDAMFEEAVTAEAAALVSPAAAAEPAPAAAPEPAASPEPETAAEPLGEVGFADSDTPPEPPPEQLEESQADASQDEDAGEPYERNPARPDPLDELLTRAGFDG